MQVVFKDVKLLRTTQFAERIGVKDSTVRAWLLLGKIAKVKIGKRAVRIPETEIQRIIEEGYTPARKERS